MAIETTVVGSFPPLPIKPLEKAIKEVVNLQVQYGIDLISDGEQRSNMIQYFDQISGLERFSDGLRIVGKIEPLKPDKMDEFYKITDYKTIKSILQGIGKTVKVKISLTGPMTLGTACASADINSAVAHYSLDDEETLYSDFSDALLPIAQRLLELGAYLQIDEPLLSTGQISLDTAKKVLKNFVSQLPSFALRKKSSFAMFAVQSKMFQHSTKPCWVWAFLF
jgi:5-methyltetrahydropteroyltriglutamate--homocysteine methyltransferase